MLLAVLLIAAVTVYRVVPHPENFAPLSAIALCGGLYLSRKMSLVVVFGLMIVSDLWVNVVKYGNEYGIMPVETLGHYAGFLLALAIGWYVRERKSLSMIAGGTLLASIQFFLITNFVSWLTDPGYSKTLAGLGQAYTVGLPGYPTTIEFFLKTLASDVIFTALFVAAAELASRRLPHTRFQWLLAKV